MSTKTKAQLLAEIKALQKRLAELGAVEAESHQKNDVFKRQAHALSKRIQELNCLTSISSLVETPDISLPEILQGSANFLPPAWQYPQITCARITLNGREYKTGNFRKTKWKLASEIKVESKHAGSVEIFYLEEQPKSDQGPFLKEERALIDAVAERLGRIIQRVQAQNSLLETSNYLESLITYANSPIIVWDPALKITRFNRAFEKLTGYSANEVLGQELSMLFPEASRAESMSKIADTVIGEHWESIEIPILHKEGKVSIVLWNSANIYAEDGVMLLSTIAQGQDITERVQARQRLLHLNLVLRSIRNVNQLLVREKNRDVLIQEICDTLTETRGCSTAWIMLLDEQGEFLDCAESGLGKGFTPLLKELKRGDFPACVKKALAQPGSVEITDPSSTCVDCSITDIYTDKGRLSSCLKHGGKVYGTLSVSFGVDITIDEEELSLNKEVVGDIAFALHNFKLEENAKQAEQKLRESAEFQKTIFETTSLATAIIEEDTILSTVNKAFEKLSGYSKEDLEGKMRWTEFVAAEDLKRMKEYHQQRRIDSETTPKQYEFRFINKEGTARNILLYADMIPGTKKSVASLLDLTKQKLSEQALVESEQKFKWLYINAPIAYHILSADGIITDVNRRWCEVLKYSKEEVIGKPIFNFIIEEERRAAKKSFKNKKASQLNYIEGSKRKYRTKTGDIKTFKTYDFIILDKDNKTTSIQTTIEDITDRDLADEKLRQSEEQYHSVVDDSPGLIDRFLPDGTITFANQKSCKFFGKEYDELIGMNIQSTISVEDRESAMSNIASLTKESPVQTSENRVIRHDGEVRWMRWTDRALFDDDGQVISYQSFGEDITESKQTAQALREEQEKAQKYLDIAEVIMLALNKKGEITLINKKGSQILGYEKDELLGRNWFDTCMPERKRKEVRQVYKKIMAGRTEFHEYHENPVLTRSGEERIIAWHNTALWVWDEDKRIIGTLSSGEDITERVRAEHLLNALNRAAVTMGAAQTQQDVFNTISKQLKQLDISCMLFPIDKSQGKLFTKYVSYESSLINVAEKLIGVEHQDFSFPIDAVDIYREVVREKKILFTDNPEQTLQQIIPKLSKKLFPHITKIMRVPKSIAAPLIVEGQVIGMFSIQSNTLTREDIPIIKAFADQLSSAWNKLELLQNLRKTVEGTIHTIAATVEVRDPYTAGHQKRVADLAAAIASEMGLASDQVEGIRMAGVIHDLGKIQVPAEILSKPGVLNELEFNIIKTHPQVGFDLLKEIEFPWPIAEIVLQHHEKMNGSGYPQGLKEDEIMIEARILAVADTVEAMSSHRPYRPALGLEKALAQIKQDKGTLFDPDVVDACLKIFKQGYRLPEG